MGSYDEYPLPTTPCALSRLVASLRTPFTSAFEQLTESLFSFFFNPVVFKAEGGAIATWLPFDWVRMDAPARASALRLFQSDPLLVMLRR
jgi:hypothetical protein